MMKKNGFTLVELLVAMTVMVVLMAIGLASYQGARKVARDAKRKADLEQIRSALEIYRTDCKTYPATVTQGSSLTGAEASCTGNTYMEVVPQDPGACSYYYARSSVNAYNLCTSLETGGVAVDPHCGAPANCGAACICNYGVINP